MVEHPPADVAGANGNPDVFESEWEAALRGGDPRWLSYPADEPRTQLELFERVKADLIDEILDRLGVPGGRALEYACGSAGMGIYAANRGFEVTALDRSRRALELAGRNLARRGEPGARFAGAAGDVYELPFADETFDLAMSYGLLEHFTPGQLGPLLAEVTRVLRPGGIHIVDIIHGRPSVRTLASYLHVGAGLARRALTGRGPGLGELRRSYLGNYYENRLAPADWRALFAASGLEQVEALVCRPLPMLALGGAAEGLYVAALRGLLPAWRRYDRGAPPALAGLGWMYLVYGVKGGG